MWTCLPKWHPAGRGSPETRFSVRSGCFPPAGHVDSMVGPPSHSPQERSPRLETTTRGWHGGMASPLLWQCCAVQDHVQDLMLLHLGDCC